MENNNRHGCRWVKASERLPEVGEYIDNHYSLKASLRSHNVLSLKFNGVPYCGTYYESLEGGNIKCFAIANHDYTYQEKDFDKIEWLDESIEPCATSSENYWKQRCEAAEENIKTYSDWNTDRLDIDRMSSTADVQFLKWKAAFDNWQRLKTMPAPSPTGDRDCEELKEQKEMLSNMLVDVQIERRQLKERISELEEGLREITKMTFNDEMIEQAKQLLNKHP